MGGSTRGDRMADVRLRIDDFEDGMLPPVCVSSGAPTATQYIVRAHRQPWWPLVFLVLGPVGLPIALVALVGTHRSVSGSLPFDDEVQRTSAASRRVRSSGAILAFVLTVATVLVAAGAGSTTAAVVAGLVGALTTVAFWVAAERPRGSVGLQLSREGRWVVARGVSPVFVGAYERQEQARRATRRGLSRRP